MNSCRIHHCPNILVTFLVVLGLLLAGVHVPDGSRPHRPKPAQRTLLETQQKPLSAPLKQDNGFDTLLPNLVVAISAAVPYPVISHAAPPCHASTLASTSSGRSPPVPES